MLNLRFWLIAALVFAWRHPARAYSLVLDGSWNFALDPQQRGEASGWNRPPGPKPTSGWVGWDEVTVPHCWDNDPRYDYTGRAWYARRFEAPAGLKSDHLRLKFASVGDRCRVWLNGRFVGTHDGVNLPFSYDVTSLVNPGVSNVLALEVDNHFDDTTMPGSRPGNSPASQLCAWWNYGGILGSVTLESEPAARIEGFKTDFTFQRDGSVQVMFHPVVENHGDAGEFHLRARLVPPAGSGPDLSASRQVNLGSDASVNPTLTITVPANQVRRWDLDHPNLYTAALTLSGPGKTYTITHRLGLREIAVRNGQLLLNGEPIRAGGANHARGDPKWGGLEPREFVDHELGQMKAAHLVFSRLQHYAVSPAMLDWADEHGMLVIPEAGNWGFTASQLASPQIRALWQQHMREVIESSWDRPCVVAWSVGNEYESWTPEGLAWTRDMRAWVRTLDASRPVTFAAVGREFASTNLVKTERPFDTVDFICGNFYADAKALGPVLDRVHSLWPEKPVMITEYGMRADFTDREQTRIDQFRGVLAVIRLRPYVCGLSLWSFNDYRSRYPHTGPTGYRQWGLVRADRTPRALYDAVQLEFDPAQFSSATVEGRVVATLTARGDFPASTLRGYRLRVTRAGGAPGHESAIPELAPGQSWSEALAPGERAELIRPN